MIRSPLSYIAIMAILAPQSGAAQDTFALDPIIVSGGLSPIAADAYGRAHSVLTAEEIADRGLSTVQDALRATPGVSVVSTGTNSVGVRIRGAEANHTLILIDGVAARGGGADYNLSLLDTANIERIEVLRGPQSVFYGSAASAGVINIITRKGDTGLHYGGSVEAGNGHAVQGYVTWRTDRGGLALGFAERDDEGYDFSGKGGEKDGTKRRTGQLSGDWRATDTVTLGFSLRRSDEDADFDGNDSSVSSASDYVTDLTTETSSTEEVAGQIWAEVDTFDRRVTHRLSYDDVAFDQTFQQSFGDYALSGKTTAWKYRMGVSLDGRPVSEANHLVNVLIEREKEYDSDSYTAERSRSTDSYALEYRGRLASGLDIQAGVRRDNIDVASNFTGWNLGLSYDVPNVPVRLHASAGRAQRFPDFYEIYGFPGYSVANLDLEPETNQGFDIGIETELFGGRGVVDVTYFNERITDLIGLGSCGGSFCSVNAAGESRREGVEIAGKMQATDTLSLGMSYTYLDIDVSDPTFTTRRPRHELGLTAGLDTFGGRGNVSASLRHVSGLKDNEGWNFGTISELPSFTTVDLAASYDLTDQVALTGRVVNLFDEDYSEAWGYAARGRTAYVGLSAKW